ncbi:MAG: phosphoribosylamine--glycine ligase [Lentisphaeria bacterium]|nr:phosphoribosylamine--glycine ligase [Lentisphaeria bacterium]
MKVLVIGSGGREHALVWQLKQSPRVEKIYCAPGNAGIAADAECVGIGVGELEKLADFAEENGIDLTVVGPEAPLCDGVVDVFRARNLTVFGPAKEAAQLEGSKDFAKAFMLKYGIPTAKAATFESEAPAAEYVKNEFASGVKGIVIKADGLAAGKGVLVADSEADALAFLHGCFEGAFGAAGAKVLIEECLYGEEASILALCDGRTIVPLVSSQDHKRVGDGDTGLNTGGMGAYSPAPVVDDRVWKIINERILAPFLKGVQAEKLDFRGVIFVGIMVCCGEPKVLEFNVRFGDPEIQPVLRRFDGDWFDVLDKVAQGRLAEAELVWSEDPAVSVVLASGGYPGDYEKGFEISGLEEAAATGAVVFHAGTAFRDGRIVNAGGRVLGVSARGKTIAEAIAKAYEAVDRISFEGGFCRRDIGAKALKYNK